MPKTLSLDDFEKMYNEQPSAASAPIRRASPGGSPENVARSVTEPEKENLAVRIGKGIIKNEIAFGETIAGAIQPYTGTQSMVDEGRANVQKTGDKVLELIKEKNRRGEDTSRLVKALQSAGELPSDFDLNEALNKTNKQVIGEAVGFAADVIGAGSLPKLGNKIVLAPTTFLGGAIQGVTQGAKAGAIFGTAQGVANSLQKNQDFYGVAAEGVVGGALGAVTGGIIGGVTGGVAGSLRGRSQRIQEATQAFDTSPASAETAPYLKPRENRVANAVFGLKKDPKAVQAIKQGIPERDVAIIKAASGNDVQVFKQMTELAEKASKDRTVVQRPMDIAGQTALKPAKYLSQQMRVFGSELDDVAYKLKGKTVEAAPDVLAQIDDDIADIGAAFKDGKLDFSGSDFEDLGGNSRIISNVYRRIKSAKDAYDFHKIKRYIDANVEYGSKDAGLVGETEQMLKRWRHIVDASLDSQFTDYNNVNTKLSDVIGALDGYTSSIGSRFRVTDPLAEVKAGQVASRLLSNSPNRGAVLNALANTNQIAQKYGFKPDGDVIFQVNYADILEDVYGTQATRSFRGNIERAGETMVESALKGKLGLGEAATKLSAEALQSARGISQEGKVAALKALLEESGEQSTSGLFKSFDIDTPIKDYFKNIQPGLSLKATTGKEEALGNVRQYIAKELQRHNPNRMDLQLVDDIESAVSTLLSNKKTNLPDINKALELLRLMGNSKALNTALTDIRKVLK